MDFVERWWQSKLKDVTKLKTVESKKKNLNKYFEDLEIYREPVSYTHLDVYKRQVMQNLKLAAGAEDIHHIEAVPFLLGKLLSSPGLQVAP